MRRIDLYNPQKPCPTDRFILSIYSDYQRFIKNIAKSSWISSASEARCSIKISKSGNYAVTSVRVELNEKEQAKLDLYVAFFDIYRTMRASLIHQLMSDDPLKDSIFHAEHMGLIHTLVAILKFLVFAMHQGVLKIEDIHELNADIKGEDIDMLIFKTLEPVNLQTHPQLKGLRPFNPNLPVFEDFDSDLIKAFRSYVRKVYPNNEDDVTQSPSGDDQEISVEEFLSSNL